MSARRVLEASTMGRRVAKRHIALDEGTTYAVEPRGIEGTEHDDEHSLEWICRYGGRDEVYAVRFEIASLLGSYEALFNASNVVRNRRISEMKETLRRPWTSQAPSATPTKETP